MAYTTPTADDFFDHFEEFLYAGVKPAKVEVYIAEAERSVDDSWIEGDRATAVMYLAAHQLAVEGALLESADQAAASSGVKSESFGDASITYADPSSMSGRLSYESTTYGQKFLTLLRQNRSGPMVI